MNQRKTSVCTAPLYITSEASVSSEGGRTCHSKKGNWLWLPPLIARYLWKGRDLCSEAVVVSGNNLEDFDSNHIWWEKHSRNWPGFKFCKWKKSQWPSNKLSKLLAIVLSNIQDQYWSDIGQIFRIHHQRTISTITYPIRYLSPTTQLNIAQHSVNVNYYHYYQYLNEMLLCSL